MQKHYNQAISNYQCVPHISQPTSFTHPKLTDEEMRNGCRLGIDSFADTCVAGKHAHVIDFIDGKEISARAWDGHKTQNLRIANVAYAYDTPMGETIILIFNQSIYRGEFMEDSLVNPIQCLQNDVRIDSRPRIFYPDDENSQTIQFEGQCINLVYDGPLPFVHVRRPTADEWRDCSHFNMTSPDDQPSYNTYSSVVSRESVRIGFLIAALNDLELMSGDISNAYLNATTKEKIWFRAGTEFGNQKGQRVKIVKALYGLPGSGNAWRAALADVLRNHMGFTSSLADPDVWYKAETKANGDTYYSYILCYVDDVLLIHETPKKLMDMLESVYPLKSDSIGQPMVYLGANIQKLPSNTPDKECWGASAEQYVKEAVANVKQRLKQDGYAFNKKLSDPNYSPQQPFSHIKYRPELDTVNTFFGNDFTITIKAFFDLIK